MALNNFGRTLNSTFVSALDLVHTREIFKKVYGKYPDEDYFSFLEETSRMIPTEQETYNWFEEESVFESSTIASAANGTGSAVLVTLAAASHDEAGTVSYVRVGDIVQFINGTTGYVTVKNTTTPSAHVLTIQPTDATQNVQTAAVATQNFIVQSSAFGEGGGQPEGLVSKTYAYNNKLQIFKDSTPAMTGTQLTSKIEFEVDGKPYYSYKVEKDTATRFRGKEQMGLLWNKKDDQTLVDPENAAQKIAITQGLIPTITASGLLQNYTDAPTIQDLKALIKKLDREAGADENAIWAGINLSMALDEIVTNVLQENAIKYEMVGGKEKSRLLGFDSFSYGNYTFHKKLMKLFSHKQLGGVTGFTWADTGVMCPLDKLKDPKKQTIEYAFAVRYKKGNGYTRDYEKFEEGSLAPVPTNDKDWLKIHYRSHKGMQTIGQNRFAMIRKA